ncbi:uncharacterized protein LOC105434591 [Cucumis sativus]|uniref:uncharacterized protein LOC105434591 n=1 Tax=Cucumis sativus TaxID=3659 RepID=UPI0012F4A38A|nr:uncharacterized protein LOC105434591 [Cucumis sativus]
MKVAVIGAGIKGLVCSYVLAKAGVEVVLFEREEYLGSHRYRTITFDGFDLDLAIMVFNPVTHPNTMALLEDLEVEMEESNMSFSISIDKGRGYEWGTRNGVSSLFAQKNNILDLSFWQMIREITKFNHDVTDYLKAMENKPGLDQNETLRQFLNSRDYSEVFQTAYLLPMCGSIWSNPIEKVVNFSAVSVFSYLQDHCLLQLFGHPQWLTVKSSSNSYLKKLQKALESAGCQIRTCSKVNSISTTKEGCIVSYGVHFEEIFDQCVIATNATDALSILGNEATQEEKRVLGAFHYVFSDMILHHDKSFMPQNLNAWSALNFLGNNTNNEACMTYWINAIQNNLGEKSPFFVTSNPEQEPKNILFKSSIGHPIPSLSAFKALNELDSIQGKRQIWFCGPYLGSGSHEDGLKAGTIVAHKILGKSITILSNNPNHMVPSLVEIGARYVVTKFFARYISIGSLTIMEEGGRLFTFKGIDNKFLPNVVLKVHNPNFYWKIMTRADIGLADAYINADFSFVDKNEGLFNLVQILIANKDANSSVAKLNKKRGWWTPPLYTASIAYAKYFFQHTLRQNTITQARTNISRHYDLSNELFSLFLDDTMTYSCAIFKREDEDLRVAQLRKISHLIKKARIDKNHHVLDIGCGWGSLAIELVKQTGCHCTAITLSEEQLKYAERKVKVLGLQDNIKFHLCDYRQLPNTPKYDRIISCGMLECVGHEFMEDFFGSCESALVENGLLVLQFISMPDDQYDEHRLSSGFMREYIFPGGCLPSLNRVTTAMAKASRFCVEHLENIGIHYYQTLKCWRKNFVMNKRKIIELGFDESFIRTWEYYFDYCAAGFKSRIIGDYQIVFSRAGNVTTFNNPYQGIPSANSLP